MGGRVYDFLFFTDESPLQQLRHWNRRLRAEKKCEIRIFYFWKGGTTRPMPANNLARLSKGKMIGVRYNKDKEWVGGSYCLFEK